MTTLTKEIIEREMRIWERNGYIEGTSGLAMTSTSPPRPARLRNRSEARASRRRHWRLVCPVVAGDSRPEPDTELACDTRAERIGRAVLRELSDQGVELPGLRDGYASEGGIIAVIAAAMEDEA